jgi:hypothetical protein
MFECRVSFRQFHEDVLDSLSFDVKRNAARVCGVASLADADRETRRVFRKLDAGLSSSAKQPAFNEESALRDLKALAEAANGFAGLAKKEAEAIVFDLARLGADPALLAALKRRSSGGTRVSALRHAMGQRAAPARPP